MDKQRKTELKVGIVALVALILFVVGMSLGKGFSVDTGEKNLKIKFPNSGGIIDGSPVVVNGVKRGMVKSVVNVKDGVLITASLDNYKDLKKNATARITILEITGGKKIEIFPGTADEILSLNSVIVGQTPPDLPELVALIGDISGDAIKMLRRLDTIAVSVTALLADGQVVDDLKSTVKDASELARNANIMLKDNAQNINSSLNNLNDISQRLKIAIEKHEPSIGILLDDLKLAVKNTKELLIKTDTLMNNANNLVLNVDGIANDVKTKNGVVGKLIYDEKFASRLDSAFVELQSLLALIKEHGVNVNVRLGSRP